MLIECLIKILSTHRFEEMLNPSSSGPDAQFSAEDLSEQKGGLAPESLPLRVQLVVGYLRVLFQLAARRLRLAVRSSGQATTAAHSGRASEP